MTDRNESGGDSNDGINADDEARSRCSEPASKNDDDGSSAADVHDHDDGEQRSDNSSSDESSSSEDSSNISETNSRNSYDSERSDSEEESSGGSYDSDSFSGDSSHASHESQQSSRSSSGKSTNAPTQLNHKSSSSSDKISPLSNNVPTNYSTNRIFHQGVLPSMSRGLAPQPPYQGNDRNCDPNASTLIHRRGKSVKEGNSSHSRDTLQEQNQPQCRPDDFANVKDKHESSRSSSRHNRRRGKSSRHYQKQKKKTKSTIKYLCCQTKKRSTQILILSFSIWVLAQCYYFYYWSLKDFFLDNAGSFYSEFFGAVNHQGGRGLSNGREKKVIHQNDYLNHRDLYEKHSPAEMETLREQRAKEARAALGTGAGDFDPTDFRRDTGGKRHKANSQRQKGDRKGSRDPEGNTRTERLRDGCSALEWHSYHFPNCNEIHEIDLGRAVRHRQSRKNGNDSTKASSQHTFPWGFVGNGLWRDVFSCDPREETVADGSNAVSPPLPPAVLKIMKSEHPYDQRNFQRHRRDALVMERLSSSHHLVAIYGYCANTVLTQAISHTLDDVIYARENEQVKKWSPHGGYKTKPPLESWMGKDDDGDLVATRENELGRIRLALGVFRGLMDLHEGDGTVRNREWLPVVHADIQSKQYLVDAQTGQIYLNDFNRCRFVTKTDRPVNSTANKSSASGTLEKCPLYIPSAPGAARSPEEYQFAPLSEKLDIYSAGNILYGIITGNRPWNDERGKHIKAAIKKGERPPVDDAIRNAEGTVDAELTRLLDWVYEGDPMKRASAKEIVGELETMLERELERKVPLQGKGKHTSYLAEHEEQQEEEQVQTLRRRL